MSTATSPHTSDVVLLGIDFTWAPLDERGRLSYGPADARALLARARQLPEVDEAAVLSTCNRTEFYVVGRSGVADAFLALVRADRPDAPAHSAACALRRASGDDALRHLFRVASGIASLILGDAFILRQMKEALATSSAAGTLGPCLSRAFQQAFDVGRRARRETAIARGDTSLGAAIAAVIAQQATPQPRILLIGAGAVARDVARQVTKRRAGALTVINRTAAHADALAVLCGARTAPWEAIEAECAAADVVVCATASRLPIIRPGMLAGGGRRQALLVDAGVPRNIDPPADRACVTVDDLVARRDEARLQREAAVPAVERLVDREVERWRRWVAGRPVEGLLKSLFGAETAARRQLARELMNRGWHGSAAEAEALFAKCTGAMLKRHAAELREWADGIETDAPAPGPAVADVRT